MNSCGREIRITASDGQMFCRCTDRLFDVDVWRRFGRAVQNITLHTFQLGWREALWGANHRERPLDGAAARCIGIFVAEAKQNKSVLDVDLDLAAGVSVDDLRELILYNGALKDLSLCYPGYRYH